MATNYGYDTYCITDVPLIDTQVTDPVQVIGQRIARRLQTPRGGLAAIDPAAADFGLDVRQFALGRLSPAALSQAQLQISAECTKDEEVGGAEVTIDFVNGGAMTIAITLTSAAGPFELTLNVTQLTVEAVFG